MRKFLPLFAAITITTIFSGCFDGEQQAEKNATQGSIIAVVDLDDVAKRVGRDKLFTESLAQRQTALNDELVKMQEDLRTKVNAKQASLGPNPSETAAKEFEQFQQQAGTELNQALQAAQAKLAEEQAVLVTRFREEIRPMAQEAAKSIGATMVVTKNDAFLLMHDAKHDITDKVVAALIAKAPSASKANASPTPVN